MADKKPKKEEKKNHKKFVIWFWLLFGGPVVGTIVFVFLLSIFGDLPDTQELQNPRTFLATEVYSSDMKVLGKYYAENRTNVKYEEISPNVVNALVATEDARFFEHSGVDVRALLRAVTGALRGSSSSGGGSTISQQLAKMLFPREDLSKIGLVIRKFKEWILRAVTGALRGSSSSGGGSTISQQLAKMLFPREDLSKIGLVIRKFKEWII